jgi:5-methylcytosine-specific restriction endonuclease McrA
MAWTKVSLVCPICGYTRISTNPTHPYCRRCAKYRKTWGNDEGARALLKLAKMPGPIDIDTRKEFIRKYATSHTVTAKNMSTLRASLRSAGYTGRFVHTRQDFVLQTANRRYKESHPNERCRCCDATDNLEAHHIVPLKWGGAMEDENNIEMLCRTCHRKEHRRIVSVIRTSHGGVERFRNHWLADKADEFRQLIGR